MQWSAKHLLLSLCDLEEKKHFVQVKAVYNQRRIHWTKMHPSNIHFKKAFTDKARELSHTWHYYYNEYNYTQFN